MTKIVVARRDGTLRSPGGERFRLHRGKTLADARHPAVVAFPEDWRPVEIDLPINDAADVEVPAAEVTEDELAELRTELAETTETVEHLGAQFRRLIEGLAERGIELPEDEAREQGWLVGLALAAIDRAQGVRELTEAPAAESIAERLADRKLDDLPDAPPAGTVLATDPEQPTLREGTTIAVPEDAPPPVAAPPRPRKRARRVSGEVPEDVAERTPREARREALVEILRGEPLKGIGLLLYAIAEDISTIRRTVEHDSRRASVGRRG